MFDCLPRPCVSQQVHRNYLTKSDMQRLQTALNRHMLAGSAAGIVPQSACERAVLARYFNRSLHVYVCFCKCCYNKNLLTSLALQALVPEQVLLSQSVALVDAAIDSCCFFDPTPAWLLLLHWHALNSVTCFNPCYAV